MPFIDNIKFNEILNASRNGNEKAMAIMQSMRKGGTQDDIDRLVNAYYDISTVPEQQQQQVVVAAEDEPQTSVEAVMDDVAPLIPEGEENTGEIDESLVTENDAEADTQAVDISDILGKETEGLFDEDEYENVSFGDFLKNKRSDANRAVKNADYFKAFDMDGRNKYADGLIDTYRHKFDGNLRDIERDYADKSQAIAGYTQSVNDMLDDDMEFASDSATKAYNDLIDNDSAMSAFGRYWDSDDTSAVLSALQELVGQYGKANVIAALNVIKGDNDAHRDYLNNSVDANISKYSKAVDKILR